MVEQIRWSILVGLLDLRTRCVAWCGGLGRRALTALLGLLVASTALPAAALAAPMGWGGGGGGGASGSGTVNAGSAGQLGYYGSTGTAVSGTTIGGDCTFTSPSTFACTKTNGVSFGSFATGTNAANLTGTLNAAQMPLGLAAAPASGQVPVGNSGGTAYANQTVSGDATLSSAGAVSVTGMHFGSTAITNASTAPSSGQFLQYNGTNTGGITLNACTDFPAPGAFAPTWTTGHTYCLGAGTYTMSAAQAVNVANVSILCTSKAAIIQRTGATDLFDVSAASFDLENCTLDGNSQSVSGTGPLINLNGANDAVIRNNYFQNTGTTNTQTGTIWVQAGLRDKILQNTVTNSQTDTFVWVNSQSGTNTVADLTVAGNYIPTMAPASTLWAIFVNQNSGNVSKHIKIDDNVIYLTNTHAAGIEILGQALVQNASVLGNEISRNQVYATAAAPGMIKVFSMFRGQVNGNVIDDGGNGVTGVMLNLGDIYNSEVHGNAIGATGGLVDAIDCVDCAYNQIVGNSTEGTTNATHALLIATGSASGIGSQNTITGNTFRGFSANSSLVLFSTPSSDGPVSQNVFVGNSLQQTTAEPTEAGVLFSPASGTTMAGNIVEGNIFNGFTGTSNTCVKILSPASNNYIGHNNLLGCSGSVSDTGTNDTLDLWDGVANVTLASGTATTAFPMPCAGVAGVCQDTTTPGNKCTVAFTSSTTSACTATVTGTSTDSCICTVQLH